MKERRAFGLGCVLLGLGLLFVILRLHVATDITHFLPEGENGDDVHLARELAAGELSRTMVLLVDAPDAETAARASRAFEARLRATPAIADGTARLVGGSLPGMEEAMWRLYAPHRLAFLAADADAARAALTDEGLRRAVAELKHKLASPMSTFLGRVAPQDPLLILPHLFESLLGGDGEGMKLVDGRFVTQDEHGAVLLLTTRASASDAAAVRPLLAAIDAQFAALNAGFDGALALHESGTHMFALSSEAQIKSDIQRVSIGSTIGLLLLFVVMFRSLRLMLLVLPTLASGFVAGTATCLAVFGSVHGLTLAFGAALIGVSVDYAVHFHCHHQLSPSPAGPRATLREIWPGLLLGAGTTIVGFVALMASSFPGLRQLAVFAAAGITAAVLSTWLFLPLLAGPAGRPTAQSRGLVRVLGRRLFGSQDAGPATPRRRALLALPAVVVAALAAIGVPQLRWNDDFADLNKVDPALEARDRAVRERVVRFEQRRLVVATGVDEEAALVADDGAQRALDALVAAGGLRGFRGIGHMLPSAAQQRAVENAVHSCPDLWPRLERVLEADEFRSAPFAPFHELLEQPPAPPLTFAELAASPLADLVEPFRFTWSGGPGFVTFLHGLADEAALRDALAAVPGAKLIDIAGALSSAYGAYRARLLELWLLGLGAVLALVALRHRRFAPTAIACAPALLAAAGTVGLLTLCGLELNMLSLVALLMVVSMGVDYGVFLAEHRHRPQHRDATLLGVVLAGLSTLLGFGLLSLSSQPPLLHIGLTSGVGVLLCLALAPTLCAFTAPNRDA
ncbi:MAG: MMPL family transporter [Planctomycetes bacterium]|nr:MMPL family transporter [Planctomycetota bacterium]